jgi:hypothetical protein
MTEPSSILPLSGGTLTLAADSASGLVMGDVLSRTTGGAPITVRGATRAVSDDVVTVTGRADFLAVVDTAVTVIARAMTDGQVALVARFTLIEEAPGGVPWTFSRSFPDLPPFATGQRIDKSKNRSSAPLPNTLDTLVLSDAAFVICTADRATDPVTGAPLEPGLNFVSRLAPAGLLALFETAVSGASSLTLYGRIVIPTPTDATPRPRDSVRFPWQVPDQPPGILLRADLPLDLELGPALRLRDACLRIYCATSKAWADANPAYAPCLAASADLEIPSAEVTVQLTAPGPSPGRVSLIGVFEGVTIGRLERLADLAGGRDLATFLPDDVRALASELDGLGLEAVSIDLGSGGRLLSVGAAVGLPALHTSVLPGFTVDGLVANFGVADPFGPKRAVSVLLEGRTRFAGAALDVALQLPDVFATARTTGTIRVPISALAKAAGLAAPDMPDLPIDRLQMQIAGDGSFGVDAEIADDPAWTIDLGPSDLTISDVACSVFHLADPPVAGHVSGSIAFGTLFTLGVRYVAPGQLTLAATLPEVRLLELVGALTNQDVPIPSGFDLTLTDSAVLIQKGTANDFVFQLATTLQDVGTLAFEARRAGGESWGFAAGIDIAGARFSHLPGLGALEPFETFFQLDQLALVAASFDDPSFRFPGLAAFESPALASATFAMPAGGVVAGFTISAQWTLDTSRAQRLLQRLLGLAARLDITLQVGKEPSQDSRLFVSYTTAIAHMPFSCEFGGELQGSQIALFLTGTLATRIQGRPVDFQVEMQLVANGAFFSGSMIGAITFEGFTVSNVALVIGCDWEGLPSLGVACSLTVAEFDSALAIFFDANDPSRSMLAGAVSDLTLKDVVGTLARSRLPSELSTILSQVALLHTTSFSIDGAVADDLDNLRLDRLAAAFRANGVTLSTSATDVLVVVGEKGKTWFVTNMLDEMMHYQLTKSGPAIEVMLNPQFYLIPQAVALGALKFEQGFFITARLRVLVLDAQAKVLVRPTRGILVDGEMSPIVVWKEQLFSVTSADGRGGARISVATFTRPEVADPVLRGPHFVIDGRISLLSLSRHAFVMVSEKGFRFDIGGDVTPGLNVDLRGQFTSLDDFSAGGAMTIGVGNVNLGPFGHADIATGVHASLDSAYDGKTVTARVAGGFAFAGQRFTIPTFDLDLDHGLPGLPRRIEYEVIAALRQYVADPGRWAEMVGRGALTGVADMASTLKSTFRLSAEEAARLMRLARQAADTVASGLKTAYRAGAEPCALAMRGAGYASSDVASGLKAAFHTPAGQTTTILKGAGFTAGQVATALKSAYGANADEAAALLRGAGYRAGDAAGALRSAFNVSADGAAHVLRHAGYSATDTGNALESVYRSSTDAARKALEGAGYASDEVHKAFGKAGDEARSVARKLDPFNW